MPKPWSEMTTDEKLDDLHKSIKNLTEIMNISAERGNREFLTITRRLETIEGILKTTLEAALAKAVLPGKAI